MAPLAGGRTATIILQNISRFQELERSIFDQQRDLAQSDDTYRYVRGIRLYAYMDYQIRKD